MNGAGNGPIDLPFGYTGGPTVPYRNLAINGNFERWQRGTSQAGFTSGVSGYLADRWNNETQNFGTAPIWTVDQAADAPSFAQSGFVSSFSQRLTITTTGASGSPSFNYRMEGRDYAALHGRAARFSFWIKSSVTGTFTLSMENSSGSRSFVHPYTILAANTWELKTLDLTMDVPTSGYSFDTSIGLYVYWFFGPGDGTQQTGTYDSWQTESPLSSKLIANSQTNLGTTGGATIQISQVMITPTDFTKTSGLLVPFVRAGLTDQEELAMCQRYFEKSYDVDTPPATATSTGRVIGIASAQSTSTITASTTFQHKVTKRVDPSVIYWDNSGNPNQWGWLLGVTSGLFTPQTNSEGTNGFEVSNSAGTGFPIGSAFLIVGHYTADAEL